MGDPHDVADRVEIEALRGEYTDAVMMRDYDRLASLFTPDGAVRMPHINAQATSGQEIRAGVERLQRLWDYFVQTTHPGTIQIEGDTAVGRAYVSELMHGDDRSQLNYAVYHDRYRRTPDGWRFTERVYEVRYLDTTPLAGSAPRAASDGTEEGGRQEPGGTPSDSSEGRSTAMISSSEHIQQGVPGLPLPGGVWSVDPQRSKITFAVKEMWGLRTVRGAFQRCDGTLRVRASSVVGELTIEACSVDTGNKRRDGHLRSAVFFDAERHPRIVFTATAFTVREDQPAVTGELTIGSSRVRLEIPVGVERTGDGTFRLEGNTSVSREAAGVGWNKFGMIRGDAMLHASLTLKRETS